VIHRRIGILASCAPHALDCPACGPVAHSYLGSAASPSTCSVAVAAFARWPAIWYRFYDLATDTGFFRGRLPTDTPPGVGKQYGIMKVGAESRYTYQWGGPYGTRLLAYAQRVGY
jgi:hypothetical protein